METTDLITFGERMTYTRKKRGLSGKQLAELIGVKPNTVYCWAEGKQPGVVMTQKIIKALEVPDDWFENDDNFKGKGTKTVKKIADFGKRLAFTRRKKGLLQRQLAELIGVKPDAVCCWEANRKYPNVATIQRIIKALEVPENWFVNDDHFKDQDVNTKIADFGERLAYTRKKRGLLQRQLAKLVGESERAVGCWETGRCYPDVSKFRKIIKALKVPEDWFEHEDNFKNQKSVPVKKIADFGKRLNYTRRKKGLLQRQLGELIGVDQRTVSLWEMERYYPGASKIQEIIKALEVPEDWFENDNNFKDQDIRKPGKKLTKEQQKLVIDYEHVIYRVLKQYNLTPFRERLWDIGEIGLCEAALRWNEHNQSKGISFFTFAFKRIQSELNTEYKKEKKCLYPTISLDQPIQNDDFADVFGSLVGDTDDEFERIEYNILVESVYQKVEPVLSSSEKVTLKHWLHGEKCNDIAKTLGVNFNTISANIANIKNKCKTFFDPKEMFS
ncbi:helix-turn-helix protein [Caprobacter fermentans]|uniref:Helix-turn-helix protein n=1 Tax=Caproicibacter fermentans TaxID=2576756 RepID=A0A6N8I0Z8_9FIRM|nr:helix-turn-helix domain-containing protein [Caproicibacter fermentans]MVB11629.1 helix-turn-helix protein [Caproicibacter fermentans]